MPFEYVILLANQRSGSTALTQSLDGHKRLTAFGEVFHNGTQHRPENFFRYLKKNNLARQFLVRMREQRRNFSLATCVTCALWLLEKP